MLSAMKPALHMIERVSTALNSHAWYEIAPLAVQLGCAAYKPKKSLTLQRNAKTQDFAAWFGFP